MSFGAGVAAGMLGIGGGMILGPFMLAMGVNPHVSAATSSFMILSTSTVALLQFTMSGLLDFEYALWTAASAIIGACIGILVIKRVIEHYKRTSPIVLLLAVVLSFTAFVVPAFGIY